ncbi:MAG: 7-cyano-7-deazaguanine synthase QueC [Bacteriovoracaceae bacterium]|jgi:7-cyano-7-deazaguanine synthase|nr:7-cyano-7-deazaguanine synthase QueC [Bacteriovoracaceae bacterium]
MVQSNNLAIVLVSGGMDSLAVLAHAKSIHQKLALVHLNYGQKTSQKERLCFDKICDHYEVEHKYRKVIDMNFLSQIGGSSLTDEQIEVSIFKGDSDEIPSSYVPFRNTHIIAMAVSWAEVMGANKIYIGANEEDSPGYPDCRPSYYKIYNELIKEGTASANITIETPIIHLKKSQIIELANKHNAPLEYTWSCYSRSDKACGVCDSCALRLRGFKELNIKDPIDYVNRNE